MTLSTDIQRFEKTVFYDTRRADIEAEVKKLNTLVKRHGGEVRIVSAEAVSRNRGWFPNDVKQVHGTRYVIEAPVVAGESAKLVGTFELPEDGIQAGVYKTVAPGYTSADLEPFISRWQDCDHCGVRQRRHASFVCERDDGTRLLVGRNCSRAFLGLSFADLVARMGAALALQNDDEGEFFGGGGGDFYYVRTLLNDCYKVALHHGGYSRDTSDTLRCVLFALRTSPNNRDYSKNEAARTARDIEDKKYPDLDFEAFSRYLEGATGEFGDNLRIATAAEHVKAKRLNLILAGVGLFVGRAMKRAEDDKKNAARVPAKLVEGAVGARVEFTAECLRTIPYDSQFGGGMICVLRAEDGANAVWFTGGENTPDAGKTYKVRGTIKKHGEDRRTNEPQTVLSRCICKEV